MSAGHSLRELPELRDMNEILLFLTAILSTVFVLAGWKFGKERLYSVIIVFLILIATVGGKTITFFGYETNAGNIFYAAAFLATYFLIERYGRREGIYAIGVGFAAVLFFSVFVRITIALIGSETSAALNTALELVLTPVSRVALASLLAYVCSQSINVFLYLYLKKEFVGKYLWARANMCNLVAQLFDSLIFFPVAFWGVLSYATMLEMIRTGLVIKVGFMMCASLLLYLNRIGEEKDKEGRVSLTVKF